MSLGFPHIGDVFGFRVVLRCLSTYYRELPIATVFFHAVRAGAIRISTSDICIDGNVIFANNTAGESGGEKRRGTSDADNGIHMTTAAVPYYYILQETSAFVSS